MCVSCFLPPIKICPSPPLTGTGFENCHRGKIHALVNASSTDGITELLQAWNRGDEKALEKLTPLVYAELHRAAKRCIARGRRGQTLQTTALINELYVKMV